MEGRVGEAILGGFGSGTGSLEMTDGWGGGVDGTVATLSLKVEYRGDVMGFVVKSDSSSGGNFAESSGSDRIVGTAWAWDSTAEGLRVSSCSPTDCVVVDTPPNPEVSYSNAGELMVAD
jgi:hypothetical protein